MDLLTVSDALTHFLTAMHVAATETLTAAYRYDEMKRSEWAKSASVGDPEFNLSKGMRTMDRMAVKEARGGAASKATPGPADKGQPAAGATSAGPPGKGGVGAYLQRKGQGRYPRGPEPRSRSRSRSHPLVRPYKSDRSPLASSASSSRSAVTVAAACAGTVISTVRTRRGAGGLELESRRQISRRA